MRPQKSKRNRQFESYQKWNKYYLSSTDCAYCQYFRGKKLGCFFSKCVHEEARLDAITDRRKIHSKVIT